LRRTDVVGVVAVGDRLRRCCDAVLLTQWYKKCITYERKRCESAREREKKEVEGRKSVCDREKEEVQKVTERERRR